MLTARAMISVESSAVGVGNVGMVQSLARLGLHTVKGENPQGAVTGYRILEKNKDALEFILAADKKRSPSLAGCVFWVGL
ncbi:hypothetical protein [Pseudomonas fluorescens]|uniref:hypothetical protein n=1 Tax=Pseudomonas fluorescens TaxID=294 RepID=UPI00124003E4|nr:hypothetical protein [Pseudomonas fluorescens]